MPFYVAKVPDGLDPEQSVGKYGREHYLVWTSSSIEPLEAISYLLTAKIVVACRISGRLKFSEVLPLFAKLPFCYCRSLTLPEAFCD